MDSISLTKPDGTPMAFKPIGTNAMCAFEAQYGPDFGPLLSALGCDGTLDKWSLSTTRKFLLFCAVDDTTLEVIGDVMDHSGYVAVSKAVNELVVPALKR